MPRKAKKNGAAAGPSTAATEAKPTEQTKPKTRQQRAKRKAAPRASFHGRSKMPRKTASSLRRGRVRYSDAERQRVLETAKREGLSGPKAAKRFGISTLTFYNWRKKAGAPGRKPGRPARGPSRDVSGDIRESVRMRIREMLPEIIAQEIGASLGGGIGRKR